MNALRRSRVVPVTSMCRGLVLLFFHRINKFILDPGIGGFPFPLTLTATHMLFCSAVAWLAVRLRVVNAPQLSWDVVSR